MLTEQAIQHDKECGVPLLPVKKIYADPEFNCRGQFTASEIIELVNDVASRGLLEPIIVRPLWPNEFEIKKKGFEYSAVAGFRRLAAYRANNAEMIPGIVRNYQSDFECRDVNAVENLQRVDLTFWQEAKSIKHYWLAHWSRDEVAARVNKSAGWVQVRFMLLEMEPEIQQAAEQNYITPTDVRELYKYQGNERLQMAGRVRDARKKGENRNVTAKIKKKDKPDSKKVRSRNEVFEMMEHLRTTFKEVDRSQLVELSVIITAQGTMVPVHKILAWSAGEITSLDVYSAIRDFCRKLGVDYEIPEFDGAVV